MSISWDTQISKVNVVAKRADIGFTRTDSEKPEDVFAVIFNSAITGGSTPAETTAIRLALLDTAWAKWQEEITNRSNIAAFVTNLEQLANANLDAREV